jgi:dihydrofolate reductase
MIKAIMAVDDKGGISKGSSMPWPKNSKDLQWFKKKYFKSSCCNG